MDISGHKSARVEQIAALRVTRPLTFRPAAPRAVSIPQLSHKRPFPAVLCGLPAVSAHPETAVATPVLRWR